MEKGIAAARRNRYPALVMWGFGAVLILGYYKFPPVHNVLELVGALKTHWGWVFSLISTAIFGGMIPAVLPSLLRHEGASFSWGQTISSTLLWAYKGVETDYFYRFQAWVFGANADLGTIVTKTLVDQLLWVPVFGLVNVVWFYFWRDNGYSFRRSWQTMDRNWYSRKVLPVMIANWVVWIPAVAMVYALPSALQIPVQNLILCFWVLVLVFFTDAKSEVR